MKIDREKLVKVIKGSGRFFKGECGKGWELTVRGIMFKHYESYWSLGSDLSVQDELYVIVGGVDCHFKIPKKEDEFNLCWDIISTYGEFLNDVRQIMKMFSELHKACQELGVAK